MSSAFGFFGLHSVLWFFRSMIERVRRGPMPKHNGGRAIQRFNCVDRVNHAFVIISFFGLTITVPSVYLRVVSANNPALPLKFPIELRPRTRGENADGDAVDLHPFQDPDGPFEHIRRICVKPEGDLPVHEDGSLVDPYGGQRDLEGRVLRHVSEAFAEDPVRLLRLARFAARWPDFTVAPGPICAVTSRVSDCTSAPAPIPAPFGRANELHPPAVAPAARL